MSLMSQSIGDITTSKINKSKILENPLKAIRNLNYLSDQTGISRNQNQGTVILNYKQTTQHQRSASKFNYEASVQNPYLQILLMDCSKFVFNKTTPDKRPRSKNNLNAKLAETAMKIRRPKTTPEKLP